MCTNLEDYSTLDRLGHPNDKPSLGKWLFYSIKYILFVKIYYTPIKAAKLWPISPSIFVRRKGERERGGVYLIETNIL